MKRLDQSGEVEEVEQTRCHKIESVCARVESRKVIDVEDGPSEKGVYGFTGSRGSSEISSRWKRYFGCDW